MDSAMASSSSSSSPPPPRKKYEVFLSFRGKDTRNSFVSHLYAALDRKGIITYMDDVNMKKGQSITPELLKSIENSTVSIIIFSKNYASSTWCLNELVKIMDCEANSGQTVIPIFYDVDPSDVRKQTNSIGESFAIHEVNFKEDMEKVRIWKHNMTAAAGLVGVDLSRRDIPEASSIEKLVETIFRGLPPQTLTEGLVGIESIIENISESFTKEPDNVCFLGILGMGGIGKTTIAKAIFEKHDGKFDRSCFLRDVSKSKILDLQKTLLSKVLNMEDPEKIEKKGVGYDKIIEKRFSFIKVLLVLDDVDDIEQLKSLAGGHEWFGRGSRIIITTRDERLLNEVDESHTVSSLSDDEALELFSLHAFKKSHPPAKFDQLSDRVVGYAHGLPLALVVLGSYLRGRGTGDWESALDRLKDAPDKKVFATLKISFDGLDRIQQDILLDIACFFRGEGETEVKQMLHSFGFHPVDGIRVLIQKSLIHISDGNIQMHDLIQDMCWEIVREKANYDPERYSRLWLLDNIIDVLTNNSATREIEGMVLKEQTGPKFERIEISKGAFRNMNKLRILEFHYDYFSVAPDYLPNNLRWLMWPGYPSESLPENFRPRNLVSLILTESGFEQSPDISCMPNLEILDLSYCYALYEVHPSVGVHNKLSRLDLTFCQELRWLPEVIQMKSLETLDLTDCLKLVHKYENTDGSVTMLIHACLSLPSLQELSMDRCQVPEVIFPESICHLPAPLQKLNLGGSSFVSIPESINCFSSLQVLNLHGCVMLGVLPELPLVIQELVLDDCRGLTTIPNLLDLLGKYQDLHILSLEQCWEVQNGVPQFLSGFEDWELVSKVLCTRKEVLQISFPETKVPDWLTYQCEGSLTITLSPSPYNHKLRGFALCSISKSCNLEFPTFNGLVPDMRMASGDEEHIAFIYIPIGITNIYREYKEENECCLFEVIDLEYLLPYVNQWGLRLVFEDDADIGNIDVKVTTDFTPSDCIRFTRLKVCVACKLGENSNPCDDTQSLFCLLCGCRSFPCQAL